MPYSSVDEVPDYVPKDKRKQWLEVFNSAYERQDGTAKEKEEHAFAQANSVARPNSKVKKQMDKFNQVSVGYESVSTRPGQSCGECVSFEPPDSCCDVQGPIAAAGWCLRFDPSGRGVGNKAAFAGRKAMTGEFRKFVPFAKVDAAKREVWGIVTAEVPDKEDEVCDYVKSKPYYEEVIAEMSKATDGENFMPLRQMHSTNLPVAGKSIGYEFRDHDREIFMGFKVTEDKAWKNVEDKVYTGFSHGGVKIGEMVPDPVYKGCFRYVAKPSEVSLVDNPCLGIAHFQYINKTTGEVELRKNRCIIEPVVSLEKFQELQNEVAALKKAHHSLAAPPVTTVKVKRTLGEDLPAESFLVVGDLEKIETWQIPVQFSTDKKSRSSVIQAILQFDRVNGISAPTREVAQKRLNELAEKYEIDVAKEKEKSVTLRNHLRKGLRARVNRYARLHGDPGHSLTYLDNDLGQLAKGMFEVSRLAQHVNCLADMLCCVTCEQEWERDENSPVPAMLEANVNALLDTLVEMVAEETQELREEMAAKT